MKRLVFLALVLILCLPQTALPQDAHHDSSMEGNVVAGQAGGGSATKEALAAKLAEETAALDRARQELKELVGERDRLAAEHKPELQLAGEVGALMRDAAAELLSLTEEAPVREAPGLNPDRLGQIVGTRGGLGETDLESIFQYALNYLQASSKVVVLEAGFIDRQGRERQGKIIQLGNLSAIYSSNGAVGYLEPEPEAGRWLEASAPPTNIRRSLTGFINGEADSVYLDVSGGTAIRQLALETTWWESLIRGGVLVWPILLIGLTAFFLVLERIFFLVRVRRNTDGLMTAVTDLVLQRDYQGAQAAADKFSGLPTGNVLRAGLAQRGRPQEIMESGLSEAILREMPRLERFMPTLKVLAAVAPLLGLLGTVTGLIKTFHVITLYGSGDPRLMAGGIGEALITTQLGLAVAIPIMIAGALLNRQVHRLVGDMEEKALALMSALLKSEA